MGHPVSVIRLQLLSSAVVIGPDPEWLLPLRAQTSMVAKWIVIIRLNAKPI